MRPNNFLLRRATVAVTVLGAAAALVSCGSTEPRSVLDDIEGGEVILGTKYDQPGLGLRNPDKSMTGFDVDVIEYVVAAIADELGVSESRVSQMRAEALSLLREALNRELDPQLVQPAARPEGCAARRRESYFAAVASRHAAALRPARVALERRRRPARPPLALDGPQRVLVQAEGGPGADAQPPHCARPGQHHRA